MQTGLHLTSAPPSNNNNNNNPDPPPLYPKTDTRLPTRALHIHIYLSREEEASVKRKQRDSHTCTRNRTAHTRNCSPGRVRMADATASAVPAMPPVSSDRTRRNGHHHASKPSSSSSASTSETEHDHEQERKSRADRPRLASRKPSASILVPRDHPEIEIQQEEFPPDDARAMSPRRNSADVNRLGREARETLEQHSKTLQSSLQALVERIEEAINDAGKLETENQFLQDYIGDLTRTMAASAELTSTSGSGKGKRAQK